MRSAGASLLATSADSRHTIASLFMLRRCASAESLSRSYTSSGMFFKVSVVGMSWRSNQIGAIMVPLVLPVKPLRANPSLQPTFKRLRLLPAAELKR
jgi:hypothetical protein